MRLVRSLVVVASLLAPAGALMGDALSVVAELPVAGAPRTLEARRLGRDGELFLVAVTETNVQTWRGGAVSEPVVSPRGGTFHAFADLDGDGLLDLVVCGWDDRITLLRGDGAGRFEERGTLLFSGLPRGLAAADVDGDGRPDLLLGNVSASLDWSSLLVYRSLGSFAFDVPRATDLLLPGVIGTGVYSVSSVVAGDLDGDGLADVVVRSSYGSLSVWRGAGDGTFAPGQTGFAATSGPAVLADLDADGHLDLVYVPWGRFSPPTFAVYLNRGDGSFRLAPAPGVTVSGPVAVADADGDGTLDLVLATAAKVSVFPGDGHGSFGPEDPRAAPAYDPLGDPLDLAVLPWSSAAQTAFAVLTGRGVVVLGAGSSRVDLLAVPVLLATTGVHGTRFDSDLLVTNAGTSPARVELRYEAASGGGSGVVTRDVAAGQQLFAPSALDFLLDAGLPIAREGPLLGTLRVAVSGASLPSAVRVAVRTTSPGGAGVSYAAVPSLDALRDDAVVPWLVESERDRSNLALVNAGRDGDGPVTLRATVVSGDPSLPGEATLPDVTLAPGGFAQVGRVLDAAGLAARRGWARITRVAGDAPFLAWGTVNDEETGDGSFVPAVRPAAGGAGCPVVPSVVQSSRYATELVVTNTGAATTKVGLTLAATGTVLEATLAPGELLDLPDLFAELRRLGLPGAPAEGTAVASPLFVCPGPATGILAGVRVSAAGSAGGRFGLHEPAVPALLHPVASVVVPDLRQDAATRTNLAIVDLKVPGRFRVDVFDGTTGRLAGSRDGLDVPVNGFLQLDSVLRELAPGVARGWARVVPSGPAWFVAYGVVMDGAAPGLGSDDGSFLAGTPE